jgi:hypothetical protein
MDSRLANVTLEEITVGAEIAGYLTALKAFFQFPPVNLD